MKYILLVALLLALPAIAVNQATVTPGVWNGYSSSTIVTRDHLSEAACAEALRVRGPGTYSCRTISRVVVVDVPLAGKAIARWTAPTTCKDNTPISNCVVVSYRVVYGRSPTQLTEVVQVPATVTSREFIGLAAGTWYFAVIAVAATSESDPTGAVTKVVL